MEVLTTTEMDRADRLTIAAGIPGFGLMLSAGQAVAEAAAGEVGRLERRYSRYRADSVVASINAVAAHGGALDVDAETTEVLDYAFACYRKSEGLFDITSGVLRRIWDFSTSCLPTQDAVDQVLRLVGLDKVVWEAPHLGFPKAGMEIDFGGIIKEHAADRAAGVCACLGLCHGLVELGGDIRVIGPHRDGSLWRIGLRHPFEADTAITMVELAGGGLASSGNYERFVEIEGRRYGHLLNPRTGWPVQGLASVSVAAESCLVAGSIASIAMLKQREGILWLAGLGLRHLWVDDGGRQGGNLPSSSIALAAESR